MHTCATREATEWQLVGSFTLVGSVKQNSKCTIQETFINPRGKLFYLVTGKMMFSPCVLVTTVPKRCAKCWDQSRHDVFSHSIGGCNHWEIRSDQTETDYSSPQSFIDSSHMCRTYWVQAPKLVQAHVFVICKLLQIEINGLENL